MTMRSPILRALSLGALLALAACGRGDGKASDTTALADSALARDLAMAAAPAPADVPLAIGDTALSAPRATAPAARASRPAPSAPRPVPAPSTPRPSAAPRPTPAPPPVAAPTPVPVPTPAPAPVPAPRARGIAAGTGLAVSTGSAVCTRNLPGDKLVATLSQDVTGADGAVLRAGSKVVLEVASVEKGDASGAGARIDFRVRAVDDGARSYPASADGVATGPFEKTAIAGRKGSDATKVIGGAIAGAILGQAIGKDTKGTVIGAAAGAAAGTVAAKASGGGYDSCLPAGSNVRLTLREPIVM